MRKLLEQHKLTEHFIENHIKKVKSFCVVLAMGLVLTSCSIYSSGFNCPDSKGARCMMLGDVDRIVDSGEIETIYQNRKCITGKCSSVSNVPKLETNAKAILENNTKYYGQE